MEAAEQTRTDESIDARPIDSQPTPPRKVPAPPALKLIRFIVMSLGWLLPGPISAWVYRLWFKTRHYHPKANEKATLNRALRGDIEWHGKKLAVFVWGTGPTVLLVHGWHGSSANFVEFVGPLVRAGFKVVALDQPAHGRSPGKRTTLIEIADSIITVAKIHNPVHAIISHSFGTPCATLAMANGLKINRFISIAAPATIKTPYRAFIETLQLPKHIETRFRNKLEKDFGKELWSNFSPAEHAKEFGLPALLIHDSDDQSFPAEESDILANAWRGTSKVIHTTGLGHMRILKSHKIIGQAVMFLLEEK